jgi:Cu-Zn family superoxide dismutase
MTRLKMCGLLLVLICASVASLSGHDELRAKADISGPSGISGTALFVQRGNKVVVVVHVQGDPTVLLPGRHGMHVHEFGDCDSPGFTTAGGHFSPGPFGNSATVTNHPFHMGDLENLEVDDNGEGRLETVTTRITLSPSDTSVFGPNGSAIIIHQLEDQHSCQPDPATGLCTGVSGGPRLACGVIQPVSEDMKRDRDDDGRHGEHRR